MKEEFFYGKPWLSTSWKDVVHKKKIKFSPIEDEAACRIEKVGEDEKISAPNVRNVPKEYCSAEDILLFLVE